MNDSSPFAYATPPTIIRRRKRLGCLPMGCIILVLILMLLGVVFGSCFWLVTQGGQAFFSDKQVLARTVTATDEQYQALVAKLTPFGQAMNEGHAATLELTPDDLNVLIARSPQFTAWRGRLFLAATGDQLTADVSTPLNADDNQQIYFNGRVTLDASYASNGFAFFFRRIEPLDPEQAKSRFANFLNSSPVLNVLSQQISASVNDGFHKQASQDAATADLLRKLRTVVVQDGKIIVTLHEQPGQTGPAPTPTPVATGDNQA